MPAYCYLSDNEIVNWSKVEDDKKCNDLLQELRELSSDNYLIQVITRYPKKKWWKRKPPLPIKTYTLYYLTNNCIEAQVINLCTEHGGSVFTFSSRSDVMNYMMGCISGLEFKK